MLTTMSILSRNQGILSPKAETEADYFARFAPKGRHHNQWPLARLFRWPNLIWRKATLAK